VKPSPFEYVRARTVDEATSGLARYEGDAKVIAGGQSLVPMMNLRLAAPAALVDVNRIPGLAGVQWDHGSLNVGALVRHRHLERYPAPLPGFALLPKAATYIGHYGVRDRGSVGGSIAHADPTAEWCLMAALFDAEIQVAGTRGLRAIASTDFFEGFLSTSLETDEIIIGIRFPSGAQFSAIQEYAQRHGDFAVVAAAVAFDMDGGVARNVRVAAGGVAANAIRLADVEVLLEGTEPTEDIIAAAQRAAVDAVDPSGDAHASADYRRQLTGTLVARALRGALLAGPDETLDVDWSARP
jgi:carbon-monoxide dehydrogenase medium subunit